MKLYHSPASPYVRKVMVSALHLGLADGIERIAASPSPVKPDPVLSAQNPLGKLPAAVLSDGTLLVGSRTICEYLAAQGSDPTWLPAPGPARWAVLELHDLGDGILDAALVVRYETFVRPEAFRWADWVSGQMLKIDTALARLDSMTDRLQGPLNLGNVTVGCALGYLDFRFAHHDWRTANPRLAAWWADFDQIPVMAQTRPA